MLWDRLKRFFTDTDEENKVGAEALLEPILLEPDQNPWGVPVFDLRPVTLTLTSMSQSAECAANATSFGRDDGTGFIGVAPEIDSVIPVGLRFPIDGVLADGALFLPEVMEHKWAIYYHRGQMIFVRSWTRQVVAIAEVRLDGDFAEITSVRGTFLGGETSPSITVRTLEFLLRTHVLALPYPLPLPEAFAVDVKAAAVAAFGVAGNLAHFATFYPIPPEPIAKPVRSISVLHFAVLRGDTAKIRELLQSGVPPGLAAKDGTTPLMLAAEKRDQEGVALLLDRGADASAADARGFTALHRAAEMGEFEIAELLLLRGASPLAEAGGHTALSLAKLQGEARMVALLSR